MAIGGVLFDFSGTLFRLRPDEDWLSIVTGTDGEPLDAATHDELKRRLATPITSFTRFDDEHQHAWDNRDLDPDLNRKVFLEVFRQGGVAVREQAEQLYRHLVDPTCWQPYPDTEAALRRLADREIPVAVVSNIAFDIRPAFKANGLDGHVDEFVLSFEEGLVKPDGRIFRRALERIGVAPAEALMIGDNEEIDGAARAIGVRFHHVSPDPLSERPDALLAALRDQDAL